MLTSNPRCPCCRWLTELPSQLGLVPSQGKLSDAVHSRTHYFHLSQEAEGAGLRLLGGVAAFKRCCDTDLMQQITKRVITVFVLDVLFKANIIISMFPLQRTHYSILKCYFSTFSCFKSSWELARVFDVFQFTPPSSSSLSSPLL